MIALESRSSVVSVSGLFSSKNIPDNFPYADEMRKTTKGMLVDNESCIAVPDRSWVVDPVVNEEKLIIAELDHQKVREERQNFDPSGHYFCPNVLTLNVNKERQ